MKIILLGYMTSGKSTIGKKLAETNNLPFIDLDHYIEREEKKTISEIFNQKGEIYFRKQETAYLKALLAKGEDFVLSLGGGTPCFAGNMELLKENKGNVSVYLKGSVQTIVSRLKNEKQQRPLVADIDVDALDEFVAKHLFERNHYYSKADHTVSIDNKDIQGICEQVNALFN